MIRRHSMMDTNGVVHQSPSAAEFNEFVEDRNARKNDNTPKSISQFLLDERDFEHYKKVQLETVLSRCDEILSGVKDERFSISVDGVDYPIDVKSVVKSSLRDLFSHYENAWRFTVGADYILNHHNETFDRPVQRAIYRCYSDLFKEEFDYDPIFPAVALYVVMRKCGCDANLCFGDVTWNDKQASYMWLEVNGLIVDVFGHKAFNRMLEDEHMEDYEFVDKILTPYIGSYEDSPMIYDKAVCHSAILVRLLAYKNVESYLDSLANNDGWRFIYRMLNDTPDGDLDLQLRSYCKDTFFDLFDADDELLAMYSYESESNLESGETSWKPNVVASSVAMFRMLDDFVAQECNEHCELVIRDINSDKVLKVKCFPHEITAAVGFVWSRVKAPVFESIAINHQTEQCTVSMRFDNDCFESAYYLFNHGYLKKLTV